LGVGKRVKNNKLLIYCHPERPLAAQDLGLIPDKPQMNTDETSSPKGDRGAFLWEEGQG
jgi:hypothetical protein